MRIFVLSKREGIKFAALSSHPTEDDAWETASKLINHDALLAIGIDPNLAAIAAKTWGQLTEWKEEFRVDEIPYYNPHEIDPLSYLMSFVQKEKIKTHQLDEVIGDIYQEYATPEQQLRFLYELCGRNEIAVKNAIQKILER